jgi:hypothetical protein
VKDGWGCGKEEKRRDGGTWLFMRLPSCLRGKEVKGVMEHEIIRFTGNLNRNLSISCKLW